MRHLSIVILIKWSLIGYGQSLMGKLHSNNLYSVTISDSITEGIKHEQILGVNWEFFSLHTGYRLANKNIVSIHIYRDSLMYYEEKDTNGNYLFLGTLKLDTTSYITTPNSAPYKSKNGQTLLVNDTLYNWVQNGVWETLLSNGLSKVSTFKMGVKINEKINIRPTCQPAVSIEIDSSNYHLDGENYHFISSNKKHVKKSIFGTWYHPYCTDYLFDDEPLWIFLKEKPVSTPRNGTYESNFKKNNRYTAKNRFSCGTKRSKKDYSPEYSWRLIGDSHLSIGESTYTIIYIDDSIMILK